VVGFDDVPLSSLSAPALTTVRQPLEAMGNLAVNIVMEGVNAGLGEARMDDLAAQDEPGTGDPRFHASGGPQRFLTTGASLSCREISAARDELRRTILPHMKRRGLSPSAPFLLFSRRFNFSVHLAGGRKACEGAKNST